jgi:hypothetical protein
MVHALTFRAIAGLLVAAAIGCSGQDAPGGTTGNASSTGGAGGATGGPSTGASGATSGPSSTGGAGGTSGASSGAGGSGTSGSGGAGTGGAGGSGMPCSGGAKVAPPVDFKCTSAPPAATAPAATWVNVTSNLANLASECGNMTIVSAEPCTNMVIAGVAKQGLWGTTDGGKTWAKLGAGAGSATITNRPMSIVYDPENQDVFWESGIYNGGGVYKTTDNGKTFKQLGTIAHNDVVSVDFNDPDRKTILVGGHEQKRKLYLSTDGGQTFKDIGMNLPADSHFSSSPLVLDSKNFLLGACGYGDGACGVYRSTDGGGCWTRTTDKNVVLRPLWSRDDTMYWTTVFDSGIVTSIDQGQTWAQSASGVISGFPVELPDGRVVTTTSNHLAITKDKGKTWTQILPNLPWKPTGVTYSARTKTFFIWKFDCGNAVLPDAIASAGFDYTTQ